MHAISNDTTSSLRFSVEHCHVHAKWAFTIDGAIFYFIFHVNGGLKNEFLD
jgi:hypothetical protein